MFTGVRENLQFLENGEYQTYGIDFFYSYFPISPLFEYDSNKKSFISHLAHISEQMYCMKHIFIAPFLQ